MAYALPYIFVSIAPVCYISWRTAALAEMRGDAMDIVTRSLRDEGCDLEGELLAALRCKMDAYMRVDMCLRATWGLTLGYVLRDLTGGG
jgi:hypothetical protein